MRRVIIFILLFIGSCFIIPDLSPAASDEWIRSLAGKLERWEVEEAWVEVKGLLANEPKDQKLLELASHIAFHRGDYQEALKLLKSAIELDEGEENRKRFALFIEETIGVLAPFQKFETPHFTISLDKRQDAILTEYLKDTLEKTYRVMARQYGFQPREKIRVEVFPDTKAFYFASTLSARDIEVTGAVGLAQFNKLMLLSPRALVYGYRWLDAISHEYMHYLIIKRTGNKAPIWFHEGVAKFEETRWREGSSYLSPLYQTLLARALAEGKLIKFEQMEPSLIRLETPEDVQLAYAQAASAIEYIIARTGNDGLKDVMGRMAASDQRGAREAIQAVLGLPFPAFEQSWREFLASKGLKEKGGMRARGYKIKEGKVNEEYLDMEEIKSLVARNRAHLGDRFKERGRVGAAILEYRRALAETQESVPILNRLSSALLQTGRDAEALEILQRAKELSPDHPTIYNYLGRAYMKMKNFQEAKDSFQTSIQINPFNPEVHRDLATVYETLGDPAAAAKEREVVRKLVQ